MYRIIAISLVLGFIAGCGESYPPTEPVSGTVTLDGNPVEGATVTFIPAAADGSPAVGQTDAEGKYTLRTYQPGDGAKQGSYNIKVTKYPGATAPEPPPTTSSTPMSIEDQYAAYEQGYSDADAQPKGKVGPEKNELPRKYESQNSSGLSYTVVEGENVVPPLELSSKAK